MGRNIKTFFEEMNAAINSVNANCTKWSKTLKQVRKQYPMNCLSVFDHFVGLALKGLVKLCVNMET